MNIGQARQLRIGQRVNYPADRGSPAGQGIVTHVGEGAAQNIYGEHYLWVSLRDSSGKSCGVWPSNRLS